MRTLSASAAALLALMIPSGAQGQSNQFVGPDLTAPYHLVSVGTAGVAWRQSFAAPPGALRHVATRFWWPGESFSPMEHFYLMYLSRSGVFDLASAFPLDVSTAGWIRLGGVGAVSPGELIYLWIAGNNGDAGGPDDDFPLLRVTDSDTYPEGSLEEHSSPLEGDLFFRARFVIDVPEPGSLLLLGTGLLGLGLMARGRAAPGRWPTQ